jgi:hypothetical protein
MNYYDDSQKKDSVDRVKIQPLHIIQQWKNGKSREQGPQGYLQGGKGFLGALASAAQQARGAASVEYKPVTHSLLTNKGFNEVLQNIAARNNAKLQDRAARRSTSIFGSLLSAKTQQDAMKNRFNIAKLNDSTKRYATDATLSEQRRYHDMLNKYNMGVLGNQARGQEMNYRAKLLATKASLEKKNDPTEAAYKRAKMLKDLGGLEAIYGSEVYGEMDDQEKGHAMQMFLSTGKLPKYNFHPGVFNDTIEPAGTMAVAAGRGPAMQHQPAAQQQQQAPVIPFEKIENPKMQKLSIAVANDYGIDPKHIQIDYHRGLMILPNGKGLPISAIYNELYGGQDGQQ